MAPIEGGILGGELDPAVGAAGLLPLEREAGDQAGERVGVGEQPLELIAPAPRPGESPDGVAGLGGRGLEPPSGRLGRGGRGLPSAAEAARAARAPSTKHSVSELEASLFAPCSPVQPHSPTA